MRSRTLSMGIYQQTSRLYLLLFLLVAGLVLCLVTAAAADNFDPGEHQTPVVAMITPVLPNVLIIIDNSGSMNNIIWEEGYDPNQQYPLYRWGMVNGYRGTPKCSGLDCSGRGYKWYGGKKYRYGRVNFVTSGGPDYYNYDGGTEENNGAWFHYRTHSSFKDNLNKTSACYIQDSQGWIWGRRTTEDNNWIPGEGWRRIKLPVFDDPEDPSIRIRFTDNYLAYLFETYTSPENPEADLSATHPAKTRMMVAREVINSLIEQQHLNVRFAVMKFNVDSQGADGGYLLNPFGTDYQTIMDTVSGILGTTSTPVGEALRNAYTVFTGGSSFYASQTYTCPIDYECQNNFVVLITDGQPTYDIRYPSGTKEAIDAYCDNDPFCQDLKEQYGYTEPGFPWYYPCSDCGSTGSGVDQTLLDGIAYMLNRMASDQSDWPEKGDPPQKCRSVQTYTIGFSIDNPLLSRTAQAGDGEYYVAHTAQALADALNAALEDIFERTFSVAGLAFSSPNYKVDETRLVSTRFSSADWSGDVIRRDLTITWNDNGEVTGSSVGNTVKASDHLPEFSSRVVYTSVNDVLTLATPDNTGLTQEEFNYILGDSSLEQRQGCPDCNFRDRLSVFGDVVHSRPAVADGMIYVGGNDGFLHAINLDTMVEEWAFIPPQIIERTVNGTSVLKHLTDPDYHDNHLYYVDLSINVRKFGSTTYLVGGLRGGGKGYFALDVTNPYSPVVLWCRSSSDPGWESLGYSFSEPQLSRLLEQNGDAISSVPVLIIGNGYGLDATGNPISDSLLIVNLYNGEVLYNLPTGTASGGLSTPAVYGPNGWIRAIYAGDLDGNLWRFSRFIQGADPEEPPTWHVTKLYSAGQPITAQVNIALCQGKPVVIGGTGRYLTVDDITDTSVNKIFAVRDLEDGSEVAEDDLWYKRLLSPGERVTTSPEILYGRVYTVAFKPDNQPCAFGGSSKIYSFKFCPQSEGDGSPPSPEDTEEQSEDIGLLVTSNLGTTGDEEGSTAVIAEDVDGQIHVFGGPKAPSSLTGWKAIRWRQATMPAPSE